MDYIVGKLLARITELKVHLLTAFALNNWHVFLSLLSAPTLVIHEHWKWTLKRLVNVCCSSQWCSGTDLVFNTSKTKEAISLQRAKVSPHTPLHSAGERQEKPDTSQLFRTETSEETKVGRLLQRKKKTKNTSTRVPSCLFWPTATV